jgi:hypothetical protein
VERLANYGNENFRGAQETGRPSRAARLMNGASDALEPPAWAVKIPGPPYPFSIPPGPTNGSRPDEEMLLDAFHSPRADTATESSSWTYPLVKIALRSPNVLKMIKHLCHLIMWRARSPLQ